MSEPSRFDRIQEERLRQVAKRAADHDHRLLKPRPDGAFWHPAYAEAYDDRRKALGDCALDAHVSLIGDIVSEQSAAPIRRVRVEGAKITRCAWCGVWWDGWINEGGGPK